MSKKSIVVVGSSNTDMIVRVRRIPRPGETILGGEFSSAAGGKGANQAVGATRAGGNVTLVARVGADVFGKQTLASFLRNGINVQSVFHDKTAPSGVALILVAEDGENCIAVASGANARLTSSDVRKVAKVIRSAAILVVQLETPIETVQTAVTIAAKAGVRVILNPAPARPLPDSLLQRISILTPNETEAELLTGVKVTNEAAAARATRKLRARGVQTVILTLGSRGAFLAGDGHEQLVPGYKVKAVDTTAAGDIFNGALAVALAEGSSLLEAVRFANAAAAISVTRLGAQPSAPTRREIDTVLATGKVPHVSKARLAK